MRLSKTAFIQKLPATAQITCLMMTSISVAYLQALTVYDTSQNASLTTHYKSRLVRSCRELSKPGVLSLYLCL